MVAAATGCQAVGGSYSCLCQVTVPCSEHHCPLFHGELGSEAGSRSCKPEKGSLEPRVPTPFPYLHDQKEEKCDQTRVYILRMNGWRFLSIPSAPLKEHLSSLSCAFPVSWSRQTMLQGDNTVRRGPVYIYIFSNMSYPQLFPYLVSSNVRSPGLSQTRSVVNHNVV